MATSRSVSTDLQNLVDYLLDKNIAIFASPVLHKAGSVSWPELGNTKFLPNRGAPSTGDYLHWLEHGMFTVLLFDGALLQISYRFSGGVLVEHRLGWVPAPFSFDHELLNEGSPVELFELHAAGATSSVVLASPIRFDFDLDAAKPGHPTSHLSVAASTCRIACYAPVRIGRFVDFVFGHFYPEIYAEHAFLRELPRSGLGSNTITDDERQGLHLAWPI